MQYLASSEQQRPSRPSVDPNSLTEWIWCLLKPVPSILLELILTVSHIWDHELFITMAIEQTGIKANFVRGAMPRACSVTKMQGSRWISEHHRFSETQAKIYHSETNGSCYVMSEAVPSYESTVEGRTSVAE